MKALVTGGNGFVGKALVKALSDGGHSVFVTSRSIKQSQGAVSAWPCDISIPQEIDGVLAACKPDVLFHLAAQQPVGGCPPLFTATNTAGTMNVAISCARHSVKQLIVSSSMSVFGRGMKARTVTEQSAFSAEDYYALSKLMGEMCARLVSEKENLNVVVLRYPGIYGPEVKETFVKYILDCADAGQTVEVRNSRMITDYVCVADVVKANILAMERQSGTGFSTFNIGGGVLVDRMALAGIVSSVCGGVEVQGDNKPEGESGMICDGRQAETVLGYKATAIDSAIAGYLQWRRKDGGA